ncbi:MAG: deoxyribodipyrimidine photo-lyase [Chlamydiae bacterium]|nr:deoxyribodipyrimidine photo-lyase [Chlamydiota bacterium]
MYQKALFIFRRDLRIVDNTGLLYALTHAKEVVCLFIFTPEQIEKNPYRSDFCLNFMLDSLKDLEETINNLGGKLFYCYEHPDVAVSKCIAELGIDLVCVNSDYTPYSKERDQKIEDVCNKNEILFKTFHDLLLHPPEELLKANQEPYTVFTPFYKNGSKFRVNHPKPNEHKNYFKGPLSFAENSSIFKRILPNRVETFKGGRKEALLILNKISNFELYEKERDFPALEKTTHLSPHLKFTTVSPREVYYFVAKAFGNQHPLIRSLYWRDFFSLICHYFPFVFRSSFHPKFDKLEWDDNDELFNRWCEGRTGFPIIDAGMRQLNQTGYMHNRVRMIVASFLVKDLHIDWRKGEKYFATHLVDYDPAVNNGNWQWCASTGCDAQPYFRIFNPWSQQLKFDPDCEYIKKWIPELKDETAKTIHNWHLQEYETNYPLPIIDHSIESKQTLAYYKKC